MKKSEEKEFSAYDNSKYSYEDTEVLAKFWGLSSPWDTKLKIARKLIKGKLSELSQELKDAKSEYQ